MNIEPPVDGHDHFVAAHHFPQVVMEMFAVTRKNTPTVQFPKTISKEMGISIGLLKGDLVPALYKKYEGCYWVVPNVALREAELTLQLAKAAMEVAETSLSNSLNTSASSSSSARASVSKKKKLAELSEAAQEEQVRIQNDTKRKNKELGLLSAMPEDSKRYHDKVVRKHNKQMAELTAQNQTLAAELWQLKQAQQDDLREDEDLDQEGLTRKNICSPDWHEAHPAACKDLFGFKNFPELVVYLACFWPENFESGSLTYHHGVKTQDHITCFEKCLIAKMRMHRKQTLRHLSWIWGRSRRSIGRYVYEWVPKWGKVGLQLSLLDIPPFFLKEAMPQEYKDAKLENTGALLDGKVIMTEDCRQHSAIKRALFNDKTKHPGLLFHAWILPCGLNFEHTGLYLARVTESALVKLYASISKYD